MGSGDFAQVPWLVRVHAAGFGQAGGHDVEALDRQDRIERRMRGALQRQVAFGDVVRGSEQYLRTALAHILGERQQAFLLRAAGSEHQQRIALLDQRHRSMADLGAAEGLGLDRRGFLEFQRGLLGDGVAGAATDHHQPLAVAQGLDGRRPVEPGGLLQPGRQALAGGQQGIVALPVGEQAGAGAERGDEALGRCDAALGAGAERHDEFAGGFQRRIFGIHQGDAQGAAFAQDAQAVHEIGALS